MQMTQSKSNAHLKSPRCIFIKNKLPFMFWIFQSYLLNRIVSCINFTTFFFFFDEKGDFLCKSYPTLHDQFGFTSYFSHSGKKGFHMSRALQLSNEVQPSNLTYSFYNFTLGLDISTCPASQTRKVPKITSLISLKLNDSFIHNFIEVDQQNSQIKWIEHAIYKFKKLLLIYFFH